MVKAFQIVLFSLFFYSFPFAQQFKTISPELFSGTKLLTFSKILCTSKGTVLIANSEWFSEIDGMQMQITQSYGGEIRDDKGNKQFVGKNPNIFKDMTESNLGLKLLCEGPDNTIYIVDENNNFGCISYKLTNALMMPPFDFNTANNPKKNITAIWIDEDSTLFIGTNTDTLYSIAGATKLFTANAEGKEVSTYMIDVDKDSNYVITQGARTIKKFSLGNGIIPYSFAQDNDTRIVLIGTNHGLYGYDKLTGQSTGLFRDENKKKVTVTHIMSTGMGAITWFSTLEKGMGRFNTISNSIQYYEYPKQRPGDNTKYPILNFSSKSRNEFFVAIADSLPAVFNTETGKYTFINDTLFHTTENKTTDIQADALGTLYITKGGGLYWSKTFLKANERLFRTDSSFFGPYITDITINDENYSSKKEYSFRDELLKEINVGYTENKIEIFYSCRGLSSDSLVFLSKLENYDNAWIVKPYSLFGDKMNMANYDNLKPGKYIFRIKARNGSQPPLKNEVQLIINIAAPFWQTWWFWIFVITVVLLIVSAIVKWRVTAVRKQERLKARHEKELLELEAKALRAQMNPHFIFNCLNSIKSLVQQKEEDKAIGYLTTFSKLIRIIFQNSDKREITLYDEIETCKLYTQLESMRFGNKFSYQFNIDELIDLKSAQVPALIIQPFIENAIWHGIMPKQEGGTLTVTISKKGDAVSCTIDDDGIGREMSKQNKFRGESTTHQSKGVHLTQSRLDLDNTLNHRNATIEIIDKKNAESRPTGTKIVLTFIEY